MTRGGTTIKHWLHEHCGWLTMTGVSSACAEPCQQVEVVASSSTKHSSCAYEIPGSEAVGTDGKLLTIRQKTAQPSNGKCWGISTCNKRDRDFGHTRYSVLSSPAR